MDNTRWQRLERLYSQLLEMPRDDRDLFLLEECQDDESLRVELLEMLRVDDDPESLLWMQRMDKRANRHGRVLDGGERIGPYAVISKLGQGGMGEVYLCERADSQYVQRVAVKVLRNDYAVAELTERFRAERQILARLKHTNISTLLDGGVTDDGRPYFVMHFEDGIPITQFCDEHRLTLNERLRLFAQVCDGVQYAHSNLVVHRDLKPSNILIGEDHVPKLLDFGIAKILSGGLDITRPVTTDVQMLTPEHAAPEQLLGGAITTGTDVYALGVLLYELLVGERPFRMGDRTTSSVEFHRQVCEEAPQRPSDAAAHRLKPAAASDDTSVATLRRSGPGALVQAIRGDLDGIVLKALRKEPERRYESAGALAEDIRLHLAGLPVRAAPDSLGYRTNKFLRRHRLGVTAAGGFALLLAGSTVAVAMQGRETARERDRAERELATSEATTGFLIGLFDGNRPREALGTPLTAQELLQRGVARLDSLTGEPKVRARLLVSVGQIYSSLGEFQKAEPLIEEATGIYRTSPNVSAEELGASLHTLAKLRLDQGRFDEAEQIASETLALRRGAEASNQTVTEAPVAESLGQLAIIHMQKGQYEEAESSLKELVALRRALHGSDDARVAVALSNLGKTLDAKADYEGAAASYREALAITERLHEGDHPDIAIERTNLGWSLYRQRRFDEAVAVFDEVVAMRRRLLGPAHPGIATSLNGLAAAVSAQGEPTAAVRYFEEALDIYIEAFGDEHPSVATTAYNMARTLHSDGQFAEAERRYRQARDLRIAALGADHARTALVEMYLGELLAETGSPEDGEVLLLGALETFELKLGAEHAFVDRAKKKLVALYEASGDHEKAARYSEN